MYWGVLGISGKIPKIYHIFTPSNLRFHGDLNFKVELHCFFNDCYYVDCYWFWQLLIVIKVIIRNYFCIKRLLIDHRVYCWHFGAIYEAIYQKSAYYHIANLPILVKFRNILRAKLSWCQSDTVKGSFPAPFKNSSYEASEFSQKIAL